MTPALILLVVDDEVLIADMLDDALVEAGFAIVTANDGNEALAVLDDPAQAVGALITDINMGSTPDGWAASPATRVSASPTCQWCK